MSFRPVEQLKDLEAACNIVRLGENEEQKLNAINALLYGTINIDGPGSKDLLHRRALFMTMLREKEIWGHPKKEPPPQTEMPAIVL